MRLQDQSAKSRRQGQGDKGRDCHGNGDGQGELLVEHAHHAAEEGNGDEDGGEHEGDRHDRSLHLVHRALRRVDDVQPLLHVMLDILDDHDGVVDDETDGENHREERQCVDAEVKRDERDERADQGYGHG